jgi:F-type H+-transporting ATPase subunit epsilon
MEKNGLKITILTPAGEVYTGNITSSMIPGIDGQFQVLEQHASILSIVAVGLIKIVDKSNKITYIATSGGICEVEDNSINVVVETAELSTEIDVNRAEEAKKRAEKRLEDASKNINFERAKISLHRAINRLKIARM